MIYLVRFFLLFLVLSPGYLQSAVEKIDNNFYRGEKPHAKSGETIYFYMERVDSSNLAFWENYPKEQEKYRFELLDLLYKTEPVPEWVEPHRMLIETAFLGTQAFGNSLKFYKDEQKEESELWVAYVSNKKLSKRGEASLDNVEMNFAVMTSELVPFTSHMGISRSVSFVYKKLPMHGGLAVDLHAFAAKVMQQIHHDKKYMITVPADTMQKILIKFLSGSGIYIGDNNYHIYLEERRKALEYNEKDIKKIEESPNPKPIYFEELKNSWNQTKEQLDQDFQNYQKMPGIIVIEKDETFKLIDKKGTVSWEADKNKQSKITWFFEHPQQTPGELPYITVDLDGLASAWGG